MLLRDYLLAVGAAYDPADGFDTDAQRLLKTASVELAAYAPADFVVRASGGQYPIGATHTPWIGYFDPDESQSPTEGLYVVWLLRADRSAWTLSVNMGTERLGRRVREEARVAGSLEARVRDLLIAEASAIRSAMGGPNLDGWANSMSLRSHGTRQRRYEAATIVAKEYDLTNLPDEATVSADLDHACRLLGEAIDAKHVLAATNPGTISTASRTVTTDARDVIFAPGEDHESVVNLPNTSILRSPRHESGLRRYGEWLISQGFAPTTKVHPRDFVITGSPEWIGEYKVVYKGNETKATREAHSQLKEYRYFLTAADSGTKLLAVFSAPISRQRVRWLNDEGLAVVWDDGGTWVGCPVATAEGLAEG